MLGKIVEIIEGGMAVDDRGSVVFANDFDFKDVKRFFMVKNHSVGFVRAWHGHKKEAQYVFVTEGTIMLGAVEIEDWDNPKSSTAQKHILSASKPQIAYIPAGYASGFKTLTDDAQIMFFPTVTMEEARDDDFRFPADMWDIWSVESR